MTAPHITVTWLCHYSYKEVNLNFYDRVEEQEFCKHGNNFRIHQRVGDPCLASGYPILKKGTEP
jgi:hypothetical protein